MNLATQTVTFTRTRRDNDGSAVTSCTIDTDEFAFAQIEKEVEFADRPMSMFYNETVANSYNVTFADHPQLDRDFEVTENCSARSALAEAKRYVKEIAVGLSFDTMTEVWQDCFENYTQRRGINPDFDRTPLDLLKAEDLEPMERSWLITFFKANGDKLPVSSPNARAYNWNSNNS